GAPSSWSASWLRPSKTLRSRPVPGCRRRLEPHPPFSAPPRVPRGRPRLSAIRSAPGEVDRAGRSRHPNVAGPQEENEIVIGSIEACGRLWPVAVLSIGLAGCAPLVDMAEPSAQGPRISSLKFVPAGTRAGCPVDVRFRLDAATEDVVSAKCEWVR